MMEQELKINVINIHLKYRYIRANYKYSLVNVLKKMLFFQIDFENGSNPYLTLTDYPPSDFIQ